MKKILLAVMAAALVLVGCNPVPAPEVVKIQINPSSVEMMIGNVQTLAVTVEPEGEVLSIVWSSSAPEVVSVDANGKIKALENGTAIITASAEGVEDAQCMVSVVTPTSFPRTSVIEHFTGDQCGYCPGGMYAITEHILESAVPYIWLSHHYGYNTDEYSISESSKIGKMLGVQGAPSMAHNRTKQSPGMAFHPGYLPEITINDSPEAPASVVIEHAFDATTGQLDVEVSGYVLDETVTEYLLTVLVKENRLVGKQADYQYSWNTATWKEYMHARVVRGFVTAHFGDTVTVENKRYSKKLSYTVNDEWIAENCCVVAYLTPLAKKPIINAAQAPLLAGTLGGEQYYPYGITEGSSPKKTIAIDSIATEKIGDNLLEVKLIASKSIKTNAGSTKAVVLAHLNTNATTLAAGTYPVAVDSVANTLTAGYRIDEECDLGGTRLVYALSSNLLKGELVPVHKWRIVEGDLIVGENGSINFVFKTYSGTTVTAELKVAE